MQLLLFVLLTWMFRSVLMMRCHVLESLLWCLAYVIRAPYTLAITLPLLEQDADVCGGWLHLNDKAVTRTTLKAMNGPLPYVLFYKAC